MDAQWFKKRLKQTGRTAGHVADRAGKARSGFSHILNGQQAMSIDWARAFAEETETALDEVLRRAGAIPDGAIPVARPGFAEGDASPWIGPPAAETKARDVADYLGARPGVDLWMVRTGAMTGDGFMPGDCILVDTHQSEQVRAGDVVIAQVYDMRLGVAQTLLRRFEPPVLVAASCNPDDRRVHVVDGSNVVIRGRVTASWRETKRRIE